MLYILLRIIFIFRFMTYPRVVFKITMLVIQLLKEVHDVIGFFGCLFDLGIEEVVAFVSATLCNSLTTCTSLYVQSMRVMSVTSEKNQALLCINVLCAFLCYKVFSVKIKLRKSPGSEVIFHCEISLEN